MSHRDSVRDFLLDNHEGQHLEQVHPFMSFVHIIPSKKEIDIEGDDDYWSEYEWDDEDDAEDEDE